jgi:hypothetical protein
MSFTPRVISPTTDPSERVEEPRYEGTTPKARPSDRLEPWKASEGSRSALARAAQAEGVAFELAAVVVVERSIVDQEFTTAGLDALLDDLDLEAEQTKVEMALSEPQHAYLRTLCAPRAEAWSRAPALVAIPMRLTDRMRSDILDEHLRPDLLRSALVWERAAVATGRSMSEWAALAALELVANRR